MYHAIQDPKRRTQHALGLKRQTFSRWIICDGQTTSRRKRGPKQKIDSFDKDVIRRTITKMLHDSEVVTLRKLRQKLLTEHDIEISKVSLWRQLRSLDFKFRKLKGGTSVICETSRLVAMRAKYLRTIKTYREEGYEIYFLDESYINAHHVFEKEWQSNDGVVKRNVPTGKGKRLIIAHCGSREKGLIDGGQLVFASQSNDEHGDYHKDMDSTEFNHWIVTKVVPAFTKKSCLVMDNASYHNVMDDADKVPSRKNEIREWLTREGIPFTYSMLRPELYQLAKYHEKTKQFHIDKYLAARGHKCLRLPPYHPHLNPIELCWAELKRLVALRNTTFNLKDIKRLTAESIPKIDKVYWNSCEDHVHKIERGYWEREGLHLVQPTTIIDMMDCSDSE